MSREHLKTPNALSHRNPLLMALVRMILVISIPFHSELLLGIFSIEQRTAWAVKAY